MRFPSIQETREAELRVHQTGDGPILTEDTTLLAGHILIDAQPTIDGILDRHPTWQHVVFDQPYNQQTPGPRLNDWHNWPEILTPLLDGR